MITRQKALRHAASSDRLSGGSTAPNRSASRIGNWAGVATIAVGQNFAPSASRRRRGTLLVLFAFFYLLLNERLLLQVNSGGRGVIPLLPLLLAPLALSVTIGASKGRDAHLFLHRTFWTECGLYALASALLPMAAVFSVTYASRALFACLEGATAVCMVLIGYTIARCGSEVVERLKSAIFIATMIHSGFAVAQFAYISGLSSGALLTHIAQWDQQAQAAYGDTYVLYGRSVGLFLNPNVFGFWSVVAFWASALLLNRWRRATGMVAAVVSLLLSQSRGSIAALLGSAVIFAAVALTSILARRRVGRQAVRATLVAGMLLAAVSAILAFAYSQSSGDLHVSVLESMISRFQSAWMSITTGSAADQNLQARVDVWSKAWAFLKTHPSGTLGPPQIEFGYSIDNEYVRVALQGGAPYFAAFLLTLLSLTHQLRRHEPEARFVGFATIALCIDAWTSLPVNTAGMAVVWLFAGITIALQTARRDTVQCAPEHLGPGIGGSMPTDDHARIELVGCPDF